MPRYRGKHLGIGERYRQGEATRLYGDWRNAINFPEQDRQEKARRAAATAGLRKRTIQILVNLGDIEYQPVTDESEE